MSEERIEGSPFLKIKRSTKRSHQNQSHSSSSTLDSNTPQITNVLSDNSKSIPIAPYTAVPERLFKDQPHPKFKNSNSALKPSNSPSSQHLAVPKKPKRPEPKDPLFIETLFESGQISEKNGSHQDSVGSRNSTNPPSRPSTPHLILTKPPDQTLSKSHNEIGASFDVLTKAVNFADSNANASNPANNQGKFQEAYPYNQTNPFITNQPPTIQTQPPPPAQKPINRPLKNSWRGKLRRFLKRGRKPISFLSFKRIVKCSLAFFLASLTVLIKPIHNWLGPLSLLAPVTTVWFDSNRTAGAQLEYFLICLVFFLVGFVYFVIMLAFFVLYNRTYGVSTPDALNSGDIIHHDGTFIIILFTIVLVFTCGFIRAKFPKLLMPSVQLIIAGINTVSNYPIGAVDFNIEVISNVYLPCLVGLGISLVVNLVLWPESASQDLTEALYNSLAECHRSLEALTSAFLLEPATSTVTIEYLKEMQQQCVRSIGVLSRAGKDARYETTRSIHPPRDFKGLIRTLTTLSQHLSAFSNAVQRQRELLQMGRPQGTPITPASSDDDPNPTLRSLASSVAESNPFSLNNDDPLLFQLQQMATYRDATLDRGLIHDVVRIVKEPLLELSVTCLNVLELGQKAATSDINLSPKNPFSNFFKLFQKKKKTDDVESGNHDGSPNLPHMSMTLEQARTILPEVISKYERTEGKSLKFIQSQLIDHNHKVSAFPEPVLIVFSGLFSMREVAKELVNVIKAAEEFHKLRPPIVIKNHQWWRFSFGRKTPTSGDEKLKRIKKLWFPKMTPMKYFKKNSGTMDSINEKIHLHPTSPNQASSTISGASLSPNAVPSPESDYDYRPSSNTQDGEELQESDRFRFISVLIWKVSVRLRQYDVKYGIKSTVLVMLLLFPAFVPQWSDLWRFSIHGVWASTAAIFVMNHTVGGTLYTGIMRLIGTTIGAAWGYFSALVHLQLQSVYVTSVMIWILLAPTWLLIVTTKYIGLGISILLAYCVVLFLHIYPTSTSAAPFVLSLIHAGNVFLGVFVATFIGAFLWPYIAHRELRLCMADIVGQLGIGYGQVSALCMIERNSEEWARLNTETIHLQRRIQKQLLRARNLLPFATREPRLRAPFPTKLYRHKLFLLQAILDQMVSMRSSTIGLTPHIQHQLIIPFNQCRKHIVSSVIHYFHLLSGALRSKQPLPPCPPPIYAMQNHFRQFITRSLMKKASNGHETLRSPPFSILYWYSYMASQSQLLNDLLHLGQNMGKLIGELELPFTDPNFLNYDNSNEFRFDIPDTRLSASEAGEVEVGFDQSFNHSERSGDNDDTFNEEFNDEELNRMDPKGNGIWQI